jgi:hypothetical protein
MKRLEEITLRLYNEDPEDYLKSVGFIPISYYAFEDIDGRHRIELKPDGIYCYSQERSSVYGDPYLEMHLNFIPETPILDYLLRRIHFVRN